MDRGSAVTSAASRDVKTEVKGASEIPPSPPSGLGPAVNATALNVINPRGVTELTAGAVFNPVFARA